jgi:hypothetical protein
VDSKREQHWISVRSLAIAVAKNCPVAEKSSSYRDTGRSRSGQPYTTARQATESVHSDRAAAASPVGPIGPFDPPAGATQRIPFRSNRSKSPFRSNTERGCFNCGKEGHLQAECPAPRKPDVRACYNCGNTGHLARDCKDTPTPQTQNLGRLPARRNESTRAYVRRMTVGLDSERLSQTEGSGEGEREEESCSENERRSDNN